MDFFLKEKNPRDGIFAKLVDFNLFKNNGGFFSFNFRVASILKEQ